MVRDFIIASSIQYMTVLYNTDKKDEFLESSSDIPYMHLNFKMYTYIYILYLGSVRPISQWSNYCTVLNVTNI